MTTPTPCYHCALPVPSGSRFSAVVLGLQCIAATSALGLALMTTRRKAAAAA